MTKDNQETPGYISITMYAKDYTQILRYKTLHVLVGAFRQERLVNVFFLPPNESLN